MKKTSLLLLSLLVITAGCFANTAMKGKKKKNSETTGYYAFSVGPSLAMGDYASTDIMNDASGAAKMGLHINVGNFGYKFMPNLGIAGLVCLGANKFDADMLGSDDNDGYWVYSGIMVGPLLTVDAGDKISLDFRPVAGLAYVAAPEVNESASSSTVIIKSEQATGFGFDIGASCRFHANDNLDLALNLDYYSASPGFADQYKDWEGKINVLGITAGLAFRF
ncbi:MAG: hypothetical protein AB9842_03220 [Bacteroidales bacterium]